jgi:transposase-like protein
MSNIATKITCPHCLFGRSWKLRRGKRKCKKCRREFSVKQYAVSQIRSTDQEWKDGIAVFVRERTMRAVMRETEIPRCRALRMLNHLRACMTADAMAVFHGPVELDETYIGGQRKNKRLHIRRIKAKKGHGTDKLPIVGLFDRASGKTFVIVEPRKLDIRFILFLLQMRATSGATVYTDGFKMYRMLSKYGWRHEYVDHDGGELARGEVHTNNIEGFWGILKRKLSCIGGVRRKHLPLFVGEIVWRFNHRNMPLPEQEKLLFKLIAGKEFGGRS